MGKKPAVLMILNGIGISEEKEGNAFYKANTKNIDALMKEYPHSKGLSSGMAAGLSNGQPGNSEAGSENIGAGRIVYQDIIRIDKEIKDGSFFENKVLLNVIRSAKRKDAGLHIMGLLSDGGVHSHNEHLYALLELARREGMTKVYVHVFTDGLDSAPGSGEDYIEKLESKMREMGTGQIASVSGRFYAMDRDNNYDRIKLVYAAMTQGEGYKTANAYDAIHGAYQRGESDENVTPSVIVNGGIPVGTVIDDDSVIFFNFRSDRAIELSRAFCDDEFRAFKRDKKLDINFCCFTDYDPGIENKHVVFESEAVPMTFGEWIAEKGMTQARIGESETFSDISRFFNCGIKEAFEKETRLIIKSKKDAEGYARIPQMSSHEVCDKLVEAIKSGKYDVIITNFPNADLLGHGGDIKACIKAVETVDECVGRASAAIKEADGVMLICSDHGNVEELIDKKSGMKNTMHTRNPVPYILVNHNPEYSLKEGGCLCDIVPTLIDAMGMQKPHEMTGKSLLWKE